MSKTFEIRLKRPAADIIADAKKTALRKGIHFDGDNRLGHFSGLGLDGHYTIEGDNLSVQVTKKPMLLSWSMIETAVKDYFSS